MAATEASPPRQNLTFFQATCPVGEQENKYREDQIPKKKKLSERFFDYFSPHFSITEQFRIFFIPLSCSSSQF
jgi:hypothetical protein